MKEDANTALRMEEREITARHSPRLEPHIPGKRTLLAVSSWVALLGLLGVVGGMDNETIGFVPGTVWAVVCLAVWIASLKWGGWMK